MCTFMMVLALRDSLTALDGPEGWGSPALLVATSTITWRCRRDFVAWQTQIDKDSHTQQAEIKSQIFLKKMNNLLHLC